MSVFRAAALSMIVFGYAYGYEYEYESQNIHHQWRYNNETNACIFEYAETNGFIIEPLLTFVYFSDKYNQDAVSAKFPPYQMFALSEFHWQDGASKDGASITFVGKTKQLIEKPQDQLIYLSNKDTLNLMNDFQKGIFAPITVTIDSKAIHMKPSANGFEKEYAKFHNCVHTMSPAE